MNSSRRSTQTAIQRLNNGMLYTNCNDEQTALLLSLSHQSGWSADRISLLLRKHKLTRTIPRIRGEDLWTFFCNWINSHRNSFIDDDNTATMEDFLEEQGIFLAGAGKSLHKTSCPIALPHITSWNADTETAIIPGFTMKMRDRNRQWMGAQTSEKVLLRTASPWEIPIMDSFGKEMAVIFQDVMRRWARATRRTLRNRNDKVQGLRPIKIHQQMNLILEYMEEYDRGFESKFGKPEKVRQPDCDPVTGIYPPVTIQSTAYAGKIFLSLIMADRLLVINNWRAARREELGQLVYLDIDELQEKSCDICYADFSPEEDRPVQLLCCFNVLGEGCIKRTIETGILDKSKSNVSCPFCRCEFRKELLAKIDPPVEEEQHDDSDSDEYVVDEAEDNEVQDVNVIVEAVPEVATIEISTGATELVEEGILVDVSTPAEAIEAPRIHSEPTTTIEEVSVHEEAPVDVVMEDIQVSDEEQVSVNLRMAPEEVVRSTGAELRV